MGISNKIGSANKSYAVATKDINKSEPEIKRVINSSSDSLIGSTITSFRTY
ncbi:MAG: hypothetical protein AB7U98_08080 [Candidatus Nitrosocosmicus sp.]